MLRQALVGLTQSPSKAKFALIQDPSPFAYSGEPREDLSFQAGPIFPDQKPAMCSAFPPSKEIANHPLLLLQKATDDTELSPALSCNFN